MPRPKMPRPKPRPTISEDDADTLTSYADGDARVMSSRHLTLAQLREAALDHNVEQCPNCLCWVDSYERIPDGADGPDRYCLNCRPSKE